MSGQKRTDQITEVVGQLADLLGHYQVRFWSSEFKDAHQKLRDAAANGWENDVLAFVRKIRSWYGGMGSFNDLVITKDNGDQIADEEESSANQHLQELSNRLYLEIKEFLGE